MVTTTTNFGFNKPAVNSATDEDLWGTQLNTNADSIDTNLFLTKVQGKETIWVPAGAMQPTASNGCAALASTETTSGRPDMITLDFDAASDEFAQFQVAFPKSWDEGTVTYQVFWTTAGTNTGTVYWNLQGVGVDNDDTIDVAYGTAVAVTDAGLGTAEDMHVTSESTAITIAGTPAVDQMTYFRMARDADNGSDTLTGDARLIGIKLFFTTDGRSDD